MICRRAEKIRKFSCWIHRLTLLCRICRLTRSRYEYTRRDDVYYENRINNLRRMKTGEISSGFESVTIFGGSTLLNNQPVIQNQQMPALQVTGSQNYGHHSPSHNTVQASNRANAHARPLLLAPERIEHPPLDCFQNLERRRRAALVLDNPELLMMYAHSMNDVGFSRFFLTLSLLAMCTLTSSPFRRCG